MRTRVSTHARHKESRQDLLLEMSKLGAKLRSGASPLEPAVQPTNLVKRQCISASNAFARHCTTHSSELRAGLPQASSINPCSDKESVAPFSTDAPQTSGHSRACRPQGANQTVKTRPRSWQNTTPSPSHCRNLCCGKTGPHATCRYGTKLCGQLLRSSMFVRHMCDSTG